MTDVLVFEVVKCWGIFALQIERITWRGLNIEKRIGRSGKNLAIISVAIFHPYIPQQNHTTIFQIFLKYADYTAQDGTHLMTPEGFVRGWALINCHKFRSQFALEANVLGIWVCILSLTTTDRLWKLSQLRQIHPKMATFLSKNLLLLKLYFAGYFFLTKRNFVSGVSSHSVWLESRDIRHPLNSVNIAPSTYAYL